MSSQQNYKKMRRKVRSSYTVSTISIALVLFLLSGVGYLIINAIRATEAMKESVTIYVMLDKDIKPSGIEKIQKQIDAKKEIKESLFVTKEQAAEEFKAYEGNDFELFLQSNPLPDSYEIRLKAVYSDKDIIAALESEMAEWVGVNEVVYQRNVIEQIGLNLAKFNTIIFLFGSALLLISLVLLSNTIKVSVFSKRYLINTMKLVGASKGFIKRPFLRDSILQGFIAATISSIMFIGLLFGLNEGIPYIVLISDPIVIYVILGTMYVLGFFISLLFTNTALNKFIKMNSSKIHLY